MLSPDARHAYLASAVSLLLVSRDKDTDRLFLALTCCPILAHNYSRSLFWLFRHQINKQLEEEPDMALSRIVLHVFERQLPPAWDALVCLLEIIKVGTESWSLASRVA